MSGGVDSAVAALLAGEGAVAVTLELWADPFNDAEASCCSAHAVRVARSVAHGMGMPHFTLDLREEFRGRRRRPVPRRLRGGRDAEPVRGLQRPRAPRRDGRLRRPPRRGDARHRPLRARDRGRAAARRRRPGQGPDLHARRGAPETLARLRFPLGELTKPQVRELAAEAGLPVASKAESQDLCFLAGTGKAAFLARHAGLDDRPGEIVDRDGTVLAPPPRRPPLHGRPAQGPRRRRARAALRARHRHGFEPRRRRPARGARHHERRAARRPAAPRRRRGRPRQAALPLARRALPGAPSAAAAASSSSCSSPSTAPRPGRRRVPAARRRGRGLGTIAARPRPPAHDHRRDPRAVPLLLRGARPQAAALVPADPAQRHLDAADHRRHAAAQAVLHRPRDAAAQPADRRPEGFRTPDIEEVGSTSGTSRSSR